ncbi:MAG: (2Fe-2S) ferredoxin domain-containing protein [Candidatus Gracilibacteria bacterium]|nr:(2Fe-2S) ferredoxin domain-containing protein [Candidatus Gracilibacteria bacterium]
MKIQVCMGRNCKDKYSEYILQRLERDKERFELNNVIVSGCSCLGKCEKGPTVMFDKHIEGNMTPTKASKMMMNKAGTGKKKKENKENDVQNENFYTEEQNKNTNKNE